jgi:type II secretory pathway pseudopilin PulG
MTAANTTPSTRPEGGYTLLEVVVVVGIVAVIMVPLLGWTLTGMRAAETAERNGDDTFSVSLISAYFSEDVTAAWNTQAGGTDCAGGEGAGGVVIGSMSRTNPSGEILRTVYSVVTGPTTSSLYRRECDGSNTTSVSSQLAFDIERPAAGWPNMVRCTERPDLRIGACTQMELTIIGRTGRPTTFSSIMRIGAPR